MSAVFDTLKCAKSLEAAGVPVQQAEAIASAVRASTESADLVTRKDLRIELQPVYTELGALRRDLDVLRQENKADLAALRQEFKADLRDLEQRLTIRLGLMLVAAVGLLVGVIKL
jgi:CHAD domain-containing protein